MKKTILAISDIHGCYDQLKEILHKVNYNSYKHQLILVGDYVDRGQKSKQVIDLIMNLVDDGAIALRGNHDQMFLDFLLTNSGVNDQLFLSNGGLSTIESYVGYEWFTEGVTFESLHEARKFINNNFSEHVRFFYHLPLFHKLDNYLFVHAGIDPSLSDWILTPAEEMIWIREDFYKKEHPHDFTIVHGHTPCINFHDSHEPFFVGKRIGIDGGCAYSGQLNCLEINEDNYIVHSVEKGNKHAVL